MWRRIMNATKRQKVSPSRFFCVNSIVSLLAMSVAGADDDGDDGQQLSRIGERKSSSSSSQKHIRFADSVGMKLATWFSLSSSSSSSSTSSILSAAGQQSKLPIFYQWEPKELNCSPDHLGSVKLRNAIGNDQSGILSGTIFVNPEFEHVEVVVRYTHDNWLNYLDQQCLKINSNNYFTYNLFLPPYNDQMDIYFAIRLFSPDDGQERWDNNNGANYHLHRTKLY